MEYLEEQEKIIAQRLVEHVQKKKSIITYSSLSAKAGIKIQPDGFDEYLERIGKKCRNYNVPLLSSIVVNYYRQHPGDGFYKAFYSDLINSDETTKRKQAQEDQKKVFEFDGWSRFLEFSYFK